MEIDGRCHCGEICYKAVVNPDNVIICHCTDCQTLSGGAFRTSVPAVEGTFVLLRGVPTAGRFLKAQHCWKNQRVIPRRTFTEREDLVR